MRRAVVRGAAPVATLLALVAACGSSAGDRGGPGDDGPAPTPHATPTPAATPTPTPSPRDAPRIGTPCAAGCGDGAFCLLDDEVTYCSVACTPGRAGGCPADFSCASLEGGGGACARADDATPTPTPTPTAPPTPTAAPGGPGQPCTGGCATDLLCLNDDGDTYCTTRCRADADCADGFACVALQGGGAACARAAPAPPFDDARDCRTDCLDLLAFPQGGRDDGYRVTHEPRYSYARRDLIQLVRYAARRVLEAFPRTPALGLGDMSQADGATPGTDAGRRRHPATTHEDGNDIDVAYYQQGTDDNALREVCPSNDGYNCTGPASLLEPERTARFLAHLFESPHVRVIGVDTAVSGPVLQVAARLHDAGDIADYVFEKFDTHLAFDREGWPFHLHHLHLSLTRQGVSSLAAADPFHVDGPASSSPAPHAAAAPCGFDLAAHAPAAPRYFEVRVRD